MSDAEERFHRLFSSLDYPLLIVTARAGDRRDGCLIGFATQCSIHPPRYLACLSNKNRTCETALEAPSLAVHLLPAHAHDLAVLFGGRTGEEEDKLSRCDWHEGPEGLPILDEAPGWFAGHVRERLDFGDHVGFLLEPFEASGTLTGPTLSFQQAKGIEPGHEP